MDYRSFGSGTGKDEVDAKFDRRWWESKTDEDMAASITSILRTISEFDSKRQMQYSISARLYGNFELVGINGLSISNNSANRNSLRDRISYNVVQSVIDTITAKISKNRPKPLFLTSGGDYKMQRKAKKLTKFVDGVFYENQMNKLSPMIFRDCCIWADGVVKVFPYEGRVKYERKIAGEIFVDQIDGEYGEPRQIHEVKTVDREVLAQMFPNKKKEIYACAAPTADVLGAIAKVSDTIMVAESWHLRSSSESEDGLHAIIINNTVLFKEPYDKDYFPFAFMRWCRRPKGFWSQGLAEQIQNIQLEINKLLWVIQRSMHLAGSFKIFVENTSKVVKEHLSNDIGSIIAYTGQQPTYLTPPIVPPEIYQHLATLKAQAYEQSGISQLSATAQKPAGLNSGKALREYNDIETERFMTIGQAYEEFHLDLAKLTIECAKDIYKEDKNFKVKVPGSKNIEFINWKDVDLEEDEYAMKVFPVSSLPDDPSGRLQTVQEYVQAGFYTPRTAKRLLDFPDLEAVDDLQSAEEDYIHKILEKIVEEGEFTAPDGYDDPSLAMELSLEYIAQGKRDGLEEPKLEMLRQFNEQVKELVQKSMPPPPPQAGPGPGMGAPVAPPMPIAPSPNVPQGSGA